jgi:tetratricopeptide (TPR) repeat protein
LGIVIGLIEIFLVVRFLLKKQWLPAFGLLWFFAFIIPPMFFKLYFSKFIIEYYEHRAYLPFIGLIIMFAGLLNDKVFRSKMRFLNFVPVIFIIVFTFLASIHSDDFKESNLFFGRAAELGNPDAYVLRGQIYLNNRDFQNAYNDYNSAIEISGNQFPPAFFGRGKIESEAQKDHNAAENDFTQTIFLDSTFFDAYIERAKERISLQNFQGAFQDVEKAKQLNPNSPDVYYTHAKILTTQLQFENSLPYYNKAIALDSFDAAVYNDRAYVLYRMKEYDSALADCNRTIRISPEYMTAYYNKGMIFLETGKPAAAIKLFDTTLAMTNNLYFGYFYRGMAKKQMHDMKGACEDWQQSVSLGFKMAQDTINRYCK